MATKSKEREVIPSEGEKVDNPYLSALVLCTSRAISALLGIAIDLNLFEIISKAKGSLGMSASEIASKLPNQTQHPQLANRLERVLPTLASYSLLTCSVRTNEDGKRERVYALSPVGEYFAPDEDGVSLAPFSYFTNQGFADQFWKGAKDTIVDANNSNHLEWANGMLVYQYLEKNKEAGRQFDQSMAQFSSLEVKEVLHLYKGFEGISTLVDVGGGRGQALKLIMTEFPSIKGINFDMPHVIQNAPPYPGIEHVGGDMFESVPNGDAILLKSVCHNWSDEECVKFLRNCYEALPQQGKVIVLDLIMPDKPNSTEKSKYVCGIDCIMFLTTGGRERTQKEYEILCMSSGFTTFQVACKSSTLGVMEFYK